MPEADVQVIGRLAWGEINIQKTKAKSSLLYKR